MKIAAFASGAGSTLQSLLSSENINGSPFPIVFLVTDNPTSGAVDVAKSHKINYQCFPLKKADNPQDWDRALLDSLVRHKIDVILLLGFLKKVGPKVLAHYKGRILNTHPSLLPKFGGPGMYGLRVHAAVLQAGEKVTGATLHEVNEVYDKGQILKQQTVPVLPTDTPEELQERVKEAEKKLLLDFLPDWLDSLDRLGLN